MKKNDFILIGVILLVGIGLWIPSKFSQRADLKNGKSIVTIDGAIYGIYNLLENTEERITFENGSYNVLKIANGEVNMISASCPDQYCVDHRTISKNNETIVCMPNKLVVTIKNNKETDVDASTN